MSITLGSMRFLNDNDYKKQIRQWVKNLITYEDEDVLTDAESAAQAEMETYLAGRYDIKKIFDTSQPPGERNHLIVMYMVDIALYHLHSNIQPEDVPELREKRYKEAKDWLKEVAAGLASPILPEDNPEDNPDYTGSIATGGNPKVSERY